jgi:dihydroorotase-like cyclic amidohydrolase
MNTPRDIVKAVNEGEITPERARRILSTSPFRLLRLPAERHARKPERWVLCRIR